MLFVQVNGLHTSQNTAIIRAMAKRVCVHCGGTLPAGVNSGRTPRYCSGRCRTAAYRARRAEQLPADMRALPRWTSAAGKRPITPTGTPASSTDPGTWSSYSEVAGGPRGVMLGGGLACIDLDHCIGPRGGLSALARAVLAAVPGAVVEKSISGRGLHVFGLLPEAPGIRRAGVEVYSRARFIRTTEDIYRPGSLVDLSPALDVLAGVLAPGGALAIT